MSEESNNTNTESTEKVMSNTVTKQNNMLKDAMIPLSIVIAGIFIGGGLYLGGGTNSTDGVQPAPPANTQTAEAVDNTGKVNPVTEDDHIRGNIDAKIKIVEYSDFDCPFCSRFHDAMNSVVEKYSDDEVAWIHRQFPLEQLHPNAPAVALASECVAKIGGNDAFWKFADGYFGARGAGDKTPHNELIPKLVLDSGVLAAPFTECFDNQELIGDVQSDMDNAVETGGRGTPWSIIIGPTGKTYPINGALPQSAVEQLIELAKQEA